jgi:hypothetical protein
MPSGDLAVVLEPLSELARLLDQMDDLLRRAKPVPLTGQVRVDRGDAEKLLDQLRMRSPKLANADF